MYIWDKKIKSNNNWLIKYEDWTEEFYSEVYADYFITKDEKALDEFVTLKRHKIISDIMNLLIDSNSTMGDIHSIYDWLVSSIEKAKDDSISKTFNVDNPANITFKSINDIVLNK